MDSRAFAEKLFEDGAVTLGAPAERTWTISAVGDICLVEGVEERIAQGNIEGMFRGIRELLAADVVFGNLETAVTEAGAHDPVKPLGLKSTPAHFESVADLGFTLFCLANNHVMDFQRQGLDDTIRAIDARRIGRVGAGVNLEEARRSYTTEVNGIRVGVLAYCQPESNAAGPHTPGVAPFRQSMILEDLDALVPQHDVPILSLHEGFEFGTVPRLEFKRLCHRFADAGAKLIFGHHPHVPHGVEQYNDALIFYSLGNFLFDFPYHRTREWTRKNFIARITFSGSRIQQCEVHPVALTEANELERCEGEERAYILDHLREISLDLLSDDKIEELNGPFITHIAEGIFRSLYNMGKHGDEAAMENFVGSTLRRDPYLKACHDFVKYELRGEDVRDF